MPLTEEEKKKCDVWLFQMDISGMTEMSLMASLVGRRLPAAVKHTTVIQQFSKMWLNYRTATVYS